VVWHGSAGLYCYDFSGKELWSRDLGDFKHIWGYGASPVIYNGRVILPCGPGERVFLTAIDLESGKTLWETDEPYEGDKTADDVGSWSTPVVAQVDGKTQIICAMATRVNGYDPENGSLIWWCEGLSGSRYDAVSSSPVVADGLCFAMADLRGPAMAFELGGTGDITAEHRLWLAEKGNPNSVGSGVLVDEYIFRPNSGPGTIECLEAKTGKSVWKNRARDHWASLVLAGGNLYALNKSGTTIVLKPNPERYEEVASNDLGESTNATPAFSDGQIFIRTDEHLYCIAD
jgi:outer membrane protein assembly factor BamB